MPRAQKPKRVERDWFVADIKLGDGHAVLDPRKGSKHVVVDCIGDNHIETMWPEPHRMLRANVGDHLILLGPALEEIQDSRVMRVEINPDDDISDRLHVALGYGFLAATTKSVHVLKGKKYREPKQRKLRFAA